MTEQNSFSCVFYLPSIHAFVVAILSLTEANDRILFSQIPSQLPRKGEKREREKGYR